MINHNKLPLEKLKYKIKYICMFSVGEKELVSIIHKISLLNHKRCKMLLSIATNPQFSDMMVSLESYIQAYWNVHCSVAKRTFGTAQVFVTVLNTTSHKS